MFVGKKERNGKEFSGGRRQPNTQLNLSGSVSFDGNTKKAVKSSLWVNWIKQRGFLGKLFSHAVMVMATENALPPPPSPSPHDNNSTSHCLIIIKQVTHNYPLHVVHIVQALGLQF